MRNGPITLTVLLFLTLVALLLSFNFYTGCTYEGRGRWNRYQHNLKTVDDATVYATRRQAEDTCRSMQAMYRADADAARMYADAGNTELATQAAVRANRTAAAYNEFVLKNRYVWSGNTPPDIAAALEYVRLDFTEAGSHRHN